MLVLVDDQPGQLRFLLDNGVCVAHYAQGTRAAHPIARLPEGMQR